jgi:hypothetical protein
VTLAGGFVRTYTRAMRWRVGANQQNIFGARALIRVAIREHVVELP